MGETLLASSGVEFDRASQLEQALIGTFFFGMAHAHGMLSQLTPPQVHALVLKAYSEVISLFAWSALPQRAGYRHR